VKPLSDMTRLELAAFIGAEFKRRNINVVLSGGSCVSIYSQEKYVSMDLDFVNAAFTKRPLIVSAMTALDFTEKDRYFAHPDTAYLIEFPPGPLGIGEEPVRQIDEITTSTGVVRLISPTDCVKDRLSWYYHGNDTECLEQAVLVAQANDIDMKEVKRWSVAEGMGSLFEKIKDRLSARP